MKAKVRVQKLNRQIEKRANVKTLRWGRAWRRNDNEEGQ